MRIGGVLKRGTGILIIVLFAVIMGYLIQVTGIFERIQNQEKEKTGERIDTSRCGIGLSPCRKERGWEGVRCINGYCKKDNIASPF